ncbi:MAG: HD domain-containing protein [Armatimonadota bacterium]|nr:HD domain-containing protein [Armatimonadota bacterium]MDR7402822.1 HD domain-containing protein [Armatimonadota bacterium]MDR7403960.1 HD domain-containing protein [Armatimonadota bacterium]MDR7436160.1 HD domain-containing protein [Armatimonadota bacterium]MDR7472039.1 HD domain-containing protein [Armatimonadota bacterium]
MTRPRSSSVTATLLRYLATACKHRAMYPPEHPVVRRALDDLVQLLDLLLRDRDVITFQIYEDTFFLDNQMLPEESLRYAALLTACLERGVGVCAIRRGISAQEAHAFVNLLTTPTAVVRARGGPAAVLAESGVQHVTVESPREAPPTEMPVEVEPASAYQAGTLVAQELRAQAVRRQPLDMRRARVFLSAAIEVVLENRSALLALMADRSHDESSAYHAVNVALLALVIGTRLELSREALMALGMGALLHDIGKVRVGPDLLNRATPLEPDEQSALDRHPAHGANILRDLDGLGRLAMVCALEHHLHADGSGYPEPAGGVRPHLFSRIVAVADTYDTVTSARRGTQRPLRPDLAMKWIAVGLGSIYDPVVGKVFLKMMGVYPVGSLVQLNTGEVAVVVRPAESRVNCPVVQVVRDGRPAEVVDLAVAADRWIVTGVDPADAGVDAAAVLQSSAA